MNKLLVPKDLEVLQVYSQNLPSLLDSLSTEQVKQLYDMSEALFWSLVYRLRSLEATRDLPTADDHYFDFCSFCMSLPRQRIQALLANPCKELTTHRIYYIDPDGDPHSHEGYLRGPLGHYLEKRIGNFTRDGFTLKEGLQFIGDYQDFLNKLQPPYPERYGNKPC